MGSAELYYNDGLEWYTATSPVRLTFEGLSPENTPPCGTFSWPVGASFQVRPHLPGRCSAVELDELSSNEAAAHSDVVLEMEVKEKVEVEGKVPTPHLQIFIGAIDAITFVPGASPHVTFCHSLFSFSFKDVLPDLCAQLQ